MQPVTTGFLPSEPPTPPRSRAAGYLLLIVAVLVALATYLVPVYDNGDFVWWDFTQLPGHGDISSVKVLGYTLPVITGLCALAGLIVLATGRKGANVFASVVSGLSLLPVSAIAVFYIWEILDGWQRPQWSKPAALEDAMMPGWFMTMLAAFLLFVAAIVALVGAARKPKPPGPAVPPPGPAVPPPGPAVSPPGPGVPPPPHLPPPPVGQPQPPHQPPH